MEMKIRYGLFTMFLVFGLLLPGFAYAAGDSTQSGSSISQLALDHGYVEVQAKSSSSKSSSSSSSSYVSVNKHRNHRLENAAVIVK